MTLSQPAPLLSGAVDYELWRLAIATSHRHMATRRESLSLGQGFGVQRAIAAGARVLPAAVLATLPQDVAAYVTGCTNLTRQAGLAASLGADFVCSDKAVLQRLVKKVSVAPEKPALLNAADGSSVPNMYVAEAKAALGKATIQETAASLIRASAEEGVRNVHGSRGHLGAGNNHWSCPLRG